MTLFNISGSSLNAKQCSFEFHFETTCCKVLLSVNQCERLHEEFEVERWSEH